MKLSRRFYIIEAYKDRAKTFGYICLVYEISEAKWKHRYLVLRTQKNPNFDTKTNAKSEFSFLDFDLIWDESITFKGQTWPELMFDTQEMANEVCTRAICHVQMFFVYQNESVKCNLYTAF